MNDKEFNYGPGLFLIGYHLALFALLPIYLINYSPDPWLWILAGALFLLSGFSITAGYHRYYAHRAYKPGRLPEWLMLVFGTLGIEGSVLEWAHDHRLHHRHVDTEKDPYNIEQGFWYAHFLWMFEKRDRDFDGVVGDLMDNSLLTFQHDHYSILALGSNALVTLGTGWMVGDLFGAVVIVFLLRVFSLHHATWFINSLAHTWGVKPFSKEQSAVNNFVISILTFGEGYHNYHHTFSSDYRNGVYWYQFDPTKVIIWGMSKLGLAEDLNTVDQATIQKKILEEDRKMMLNRLQEVKDEKEAELKDRVNTLYERLTDKLKSMRDCSDSSRIRKLRESVRDYWDEWTSLCDRVLSLQPS